jgi:tRNA-Thr(GGU) m(6)t(6)A37 methyltransferase TsaA
VPAADEQTVLVQTSYGLVPIGWVQSALRVLDDAPNQREGAPRAWIRFDEQVAEGAKDLRPGDEIVVLTWLHLSRRDELSTHPEADMSQPLTGVFSTCSPNRPNPVGLHRARIVAREGLRVEVDALEAIDGTPVVDVKPAMMSSSSGERTCRVRKPQASTLSAHALANETSRERATEIESA